MSDKIRVAEVIALNYSSDIKSMLFSRLDCEQ